MATAPLGERFAARFGRAPDVIASAPGRVNLVGEHTDYNDGFALPMAIDRRTQVAAARRGDGRVVAYSEEFDEHAEISDRPLDAVMLRAARTTSAGPQRWPQYLNALARSVRDAGIELPGCDLLIASGVTTGAGLSSSAALEVAILRAWWALIGAVWSPHDAAALGQRAENAYVGLQSGIMDQLASACAQRGHAMLIDFRSLAIEQVALPAGAMVVVMDTGVRRSLAAGDYNARRAACERAVQAVRVHDPAVRALRDVDERKLATAAPDLDAEALDCARHVVAENARPVAMADALRRGDLPAAGAIMDRSHASLRDYYRVSSPHLDAACEVARSHPACLGARLTGAGFGGCAIALIQPDAADFLAYALPRYESRTYRRGHFYVVEPSDGARLDLARDQ